MGFSPAGIATQRETAPRLAPQVSLGVRRHESTIAHMRRPLLLIVVALCTSAPICLARAQAPASFVVVRGMLDDGWPGPSGRGAPGIAFWLQPLAASEAVPVSCGAPLDSTVTDAEGRFRLRVPATARTGWLLCFAGRFGARSLGAGAGMRLYRYQGVGTDSVQLYCRGHGPTGSPECRWVPWPEPLTWPGGESIDSVRVPPNVALHLTGRPRRLPYTEQITSIPASARSRLPAGELGR